MLFQSVLRFLFVVAVAVLVSVEATPTGVQQDSCIRGRCLMTLLENLGGNYQLLPGVNISSSGVSVRSSGSTTEALTAYFKTLTLHVALYSEPIIGFFRSQIDEVEGRAKRPRRPIFYSRLKFLSIYTVFAVAFALLSALVGKAVTISIIALVVTVVAAARGLAFGTNNNPNNPNNSPPPVFDIVRRPHIQVQHTQSAEEVYEAPGDSAGGGVSFVYPIRGRAVPTPDPYLANEIHISEQTSKRLGERGINI